MTCVVGGMVDFGCCGMNEEAELTRLIGFEPSGVKGVVCVSLFGISSYR